MTDDTRKINPSPCKGEIPSRRYEGNPSCIRRDTCVRFKAFINLFNRGDDLEFEEIICNSWNYYIPVLEIKPIGQFDDLINEQPDSKESHVENFSGFGSMILKGLKFNFRIRYGDKHIKKKI